MSHLFGRKGWNITNIFAKGLPQEVEDSNEKCLAMPCISQAHYFQPLPDHTPFTLEAVSSGGVGMLRPFAPLCSQMQTTLCSSDPQL